MKITHEFYPEGKRKALTFSYDDGQIYDRKLVQIFNNYGLRGTFHLVSGSLDQEIFVKAEEIAALYKEHEISVHTLNHYHLSMVSRETFIEEILADKKNLETLCRYPVRGMSYPFGDYNEKIVSALPLLGIEYSRTVQSHGRFTLPENFLVWHPTCHHNDQLMDKLDAFNNTLSWDFMPLFYVWGHSFEFERQDNWHLIEEFCKKAGGKNDVWYATNIEIKDYVTALRSIKYDVSQTLAYNPSAIPIWIGVNSQPVCLRPGVVTILE